MSCATRVHARVHRVIPHRYPFGTHGTQGRYLITAIEKRLGKDGKPGYRVRIASTDPATGKRRNLTIGTYWTKKEAEKVEREALTDQDKGTLTDPSKVTLGDLLQEWLGTKRGAVSANTLAQYEIAVRKHIAPALGRARVQQLTPAAVQAQYTAWYDASVSPRNIARIYLVLSQALDFAVHQRIVHQNVAANTKRPAVRRKQPAIWTAEEVDRFLAVAVHDSRSPLWHLLALEAMRRGEALGLRWSDINWQRGTAHISQTVVADQANRGAARIQPRTKTAAGARTVRLTAETLALLAEHRDRQRFIRQAAGDRWQVHDLIVTSSLGTPVNPGNVSRSFEALVKAAGVPAITLHNVRHTAASLLLADGTVSVKQISERLGHASVTLTLDVYSHLLPDMQDAAALAMSRIISGAGPATGTDGVDRGR